MRLRPGARTGVGYTRPVSTRLHLVIHTDGASKGNPGPAAIGAVLAMDDPDGDPIPVEELSDYIGVTTNNIAEYTAVVRALERAAALDASRVDLRTDSELLVKQLNGEYRVRNAGLKPLYEATQRLRARFDACTITHVRRERNAQADALANAAITAYRAKRRA